MSEPAINRQTLPIDDPKHVGLTTYDAKDPNSKFPPIKRLIPPEGAPNVLIVMIDDAGFGSASAFGGPCRTPVAENLAKTGLKFNRFHTTALCSPSRAALLSGRNHHSVNMGSITETATSAPGYTSMRPQNKAPLAEILKLNGFATAQFGKCHEVPVWETSPVGPFDRWPAGGNGFEYFYGFIGGEANQWYPSLYEGTTPVEPEKTPEEGYHLVDDMTTKAIKWIRQQKALTPQQPFFAYFAPGATHAPHHVPADWIAKNKGRFDQGWDKLREETFARQKELGVIPPDAVLTERPKEIPSWDEMPDELKPVLSREMEVYSAYMEYTDAHVGRLFAAVEDLGIMDNTLIYYIIGDNGASAEGTLHGAFNEMANFNGIAAIETPEFLISKLDEFGGLESYNHYAVGWAHAMDTPYQWTKQIASHWGGTRTGTIVHWPEGIQAKDEIRSQFTHVIDVAPTVLEITGVPMPTSVNGIQQAPMEGFSMAYAFEDADAPEVHDLQYFEMFCNRGVYHQGWTGVTRHGIPWMLHAELPPFDADEWELYAPDDWTQSNNIAAKNPEKLAELQRLWLIEAVKYSVLPLDDRTADRIDPDLAGRPQLITGKSQLLFGGMGRLSENSVINTKNKSFSVTAEIETPDSGAQGVIVAQGASIGGWSLYTLDGKLKYCYNVSGMKHFITGSDTPIPSGKHQARMEFAYDGGGLGKGGDVTLYVDGNKVGEGRVDMTLAMIFSADETCDVGIDNASPVSPEYGPRGNAFNGTIDWVQIDIGDDDHSHMIAPKDRMSLAMARQ